MTDQEIVEKAIAAVKKFQDDVAKAQAEREVELTRLENMVETVIKATKCERITAARIVKEIMNPKPQPTSGERMGVGGI